MKKTKKNPKSLTRNKSVGVKASETYDAATDPLASNNHKDAVGKKLSELDFALHQINSMYTFKKLYSRLRLKKDKTQNLKKLMLERTMENGHIAARLSVSPSLQFSCCCYCFVNLL